MENKKSSNVLLSSFVLMSIWCRLSQSLGHVWIMDELRVLVYETNVPLSVVIKLMVEN